MATWLLFALIYPLFFGVSNLIDKFLVEKKVKNPYSYSIVVGLFLVAISIVIFFIVGLPHTSAKVWLAGIGSGVLYGIAYIIFYHTIKYAEISRVVSIAYIYPVFVALLSFIFLGEKLSILKYCAIAVAIIGAIIIGVEKQNLKWKLGHVFWLMLFNAVLIGGVDVFDKYVVTYIPYWQATALVQGMLGATLLTFVFNKNARKYFNQAAKYTPGIIISEAFVAAGVVLFFIAASKAPISIVSAMGTLQPVFVFFTMLGISIFAPKVLKEVVTPGVIAYKIIGILLIIAAAIVIGG